MKTDKVLLALLVSGAVAMVSCEDMISEDSSAGESSEEVIEMLTDEIEVKGEPVSTDTIVVCTDGQGDWLNCPACGLG